MQHIHQNPSQKGILIGGESPSGFLGTVLDRTTAKPMQVLGQSGDRADLITQEQEMVPTSTITTSTELHTLDNKMIEFYEMEGSDVRGTFKGLIEDYKQEDSLAATLNTAIFDEQHPSMDWRNAVETLSLHPSVIGIMDSVLPLERPCSPSDFLQKTPAPSQHQVPSLGALSETDKLIEQVLAETSADNNWDSHQLDLNLFNQPDTLGSIVQECGIQEEEIEGSSFYGVNGLDPISFTTMTQQGVCIPAPQPPKYLRNSGGPTRIRRERRASRKPVRFRDAVHLDDDLDLVTTKEVTVRAKQEVAASTSGITPARRKGSCQRELSNEEKYIRSREQNNLASKRCREKRKANVEKMTVNLEELEERNQVLKSKVTELTALRDKFKDFVNNFLFQRMMHKT